MPTLQDQPKTTDPQDQTATVVSQKHTQPVGAAPVAESTADEVQPLAVNVPTTAQMRAAGGGTGGNPPAVNTPSAINAVPDPAAHPDAPLAIPVNTTLVQTAQPEVVVTTEQLKTVESPT